MDFARDIQPILDRHCVECHNADRRDGGVELIGDKTPMYTISYWTMQSRGLVADGRNRDFSNYEPYKIGSSASRLMKLIDGSHYDAKLSDHEKTLVRLWLETSATYPGTYASLAVGPDLPDCRHLTGGAFQAALWRVPPPRVRRSAARPCEDLSVQRPEPHLEGPWFNLSHPEKSLFLRAPLAKEAGGLQLCKEVVFKDTNDPLYKGILGAIQHGHDRLMEGKRFDMPGFRPSEHYIREMQRFGFIPKDLGPEEPVDVYAVDKAYWDSFYYEPEEMGAD